MCVSVHWALTNPAAAAGQKYQFNQFNLFNYSAIRIQVRSRIATKVLANTNIFHLVCRVIFEHYANTRVRIAIKIKEFLMTFLQYWDWIYCFDWIQHRIKIQLNVLCRAPVLSVMFRTKTMPNIQERNKLKQKQAIDFIVTALSLSVKWRLRPFLCVVVVVFVAIDRISKKKKQISNISCYVTFIICRKIKNKDGVRSTSNWFVFALGILFDPAINYKDADTLPDTATHTRTHIHPHQQRHTNTIESHSDKKHIAQWQMHERSKFN